MRPLCTHLDKLVTNNFQICFPVPYLSLHAKYSHMQNMPRGQTSPGLPYMRQDPRNMKKDITYCMDRYWSLSQVQSILGWISRNLHVDQITAEMPTIHTALYGRISKPRCQTERYVKQAYHNTLVRPQLQYASAVWDPHTKAKSCSVDSQQL